MSHDRPDDLDRGAARRRAMLGDAWVQRSLGQATVLNAEFQSLVTRHAWYDIWCRPGLDDQTRRLLVLGMTMAAARWEEFELHCRAALRGGVPLDAIKETLMQGAIYCGVPAANTAFKLTAAACQAEGIALPPAPLVDGPRVETHHTFSLPQLRVALQGVGASGVPVVLSHAMGMSLAMYDSLAASLAEHHPVLRYDHRGQGGSATVRAAYGMDALVDDAARLISEWGRGPVVFAGSSMGGLVALGLAIRHPALVRGVLVANAVAVWPEAGRSGFDQRVQAVRASGMAAVADAAVERFLSPATRGAQPALAAAVRAQVMAADAEGYALACGAIRDVDWRAGLAGIRCPVQLVAGTLDLGAPVAAHQAIADAVPGAQLSVLEAAHLSVLDQPAAFEAALRALIGRVASGMQPRAGAGP